jgi:hypothetical protein
MSSPGDFLEVLANTSLGEILRLIVPTKMIAMRYWPSVLPCHSFRAIMRRHQFKEKPLSELETVASENCKDGLSSGCRSMVDGPL